MSLRLTLVSALAVTSLIGCTKAPETTNGSVNAASIISDKTQTPAQKAQRLADGAEQLLSAQGFDFANDVADLALEQDQTNVKAQFIKALLAPIMAKRGIVSRVAPLAAQDAKTNDKYQEMLGQIDEQPDSTAKTFFLDGAADIKTEADVQSYLDQEIAAFEQIRSFAKSNKSAQITLNGTDELFVVLQERWKALCTVTYSGRYQYDIQCPSKVKMLQTTIDRGDLEVIQQYAAGMELYLSLYNSYDLTGSIALAEKTKGQSPAPKEVIDSLLAESQFGKLRKTQVFGLIQSLGPDAIAGVRWVMSNQAQLCPMGHEDVHNRVNALINTGLCVPSNHGSEINTGVRKIEAALQGALVPITLEGPANPYGSRTQYKTQIQPSALLNSPIADLHSLSPVKYASPCGKVAGLADDSLGGLFPSHDFNLVLSSSSQCQ